MGAVGVKTFKKKNHQNVVSVEYIYHNTKVSIRHRLLCPDAYESNYVGANLVKRMFLRFYGPAIYDPAKPTSYCFMCK